MKLQELFEAKKDLTIEAAAAKLLPGVKTVSGRYKKTVKFTEAKRAEGQKFGASLRKTLTVLGFTKGGSARSEVNGKVSQGATGTEMYSCGELKFKLAEGNSFSTGTRTFELELS